MNPPQSKLRGLRVLITRPLELASALAQKIEQQGAIPIIYPAISIEAADDNAQREQLLQQLEDFDIAIFISPTAVTKTLEHIKSLPPALQLAAIGSSTENALVKNKQTASIISSGHDSEALLCHEQLQAEQIKGKSIVIFRGQEGRNYLGDTLISRGASVDYAEMYRRVRPQHSSSLSDDEIKTLSIITVTSNEGLQNLFELTDNTDLLVQKPLLVPGERARQLAKTLGFNHIIQSGNATDNACVDALIKWANS